MTSLLGKWKLYLLLFVLGNPAFAKTETHPVNVVCNNFSTDEVKTFTIDFNIDRNNLFSLFKDLKEQYDISSSILSYKRKKLITSKLELKFVTTSGQVFKIFAEKSTGINPLCLQIDSVSNEILYFNYCDLENNRDTAVIEHQIVTAQKEKVVLQSEIAATKREYIKEEKRLALIKQKQEIAARIIAAQKRSDQAATNALEKRKKKQEELQLRQLEQKKVKEAAILAKLEEERLRIISQTEELKRRNLEEQNRLKDLINDREETERVAVLKNKTLQESKDNLAQMKQARKAHYREERATAKTLEKQRLAAQELKKQEIRLANEELESVKRSQEEELQKIEYEKTKAAEVSRLLKEQEMIKELDRIQRERDLSEKTLNVINDNYQKRLAGLNELENLMTENSDLILGAQVKKEQVIVEGILIFEANQCFYSVYSDRTVVFNTMGKELLVLDLPYTEDVITGTIFYKKKNRSYKFNGDLLVFKDATATASKKTNKKVSFTITSSFTSQQFEVLDKNLIESGHDFSRLEYKTLIGDNIIYKISFKIDNENYSFQESKGISNIELVEDPNSGIIVVRKALN